MSPLEYASHVKESLFSGWATRLPEAAESWAQLGTPEITCQSVAVGVNDIRDVPLVPGRQDCGSLEVADIVVAIARTCERDYRDDGTTDPEATAEMAALMETDRDVLSELLKHLRNDLHQSNTTRYSFLFQGSISVVTVRFTVQVM